MAAAKEKAFLSEVNEYGVSLYGHLTEVLATMLEKKTPDALGSLEAISMQVKGKHFKPDSAIPPEKPPADVAVPASGWHESSNALLVDTLPKEDDAPPEVPPANICEEAAYFASAGVGLPKEEVYRVYMSLIKLQKDKELASIRFFGKVLGTQMDYFIAEGSFPASEEEEATAPPGAVPFEEKGTGCNMYCYFACNDPAGAWTELPTVTPEQIAASRLIRKFFTGNLSEPVRAYPPFPGLEKEYLRAQIARITAATLLAPVGKYVIEEESAPPKVIPYEPEEGPIPLLPAAAYLDLSNWVYYNMGILGIGRCTHPPVEEEEDEDAPKKDMPPLQATRDPLVKVTPENWSTQLFSHMGAGACVAVARSLRWPGAYCAINTKEGKECNLYIGYGLAKLAEPFVVQPPPPVMSEPDDVTEQVDMPLAEENAPVIAAAKAELQTKVAEEAEAKAAEEAE